MKKIEWYHAIIGFFMFVILTQGVFALLIVDYGMTFFGYTDMMEFQFSPEGVGLSSFAMFLGFIIVPYFYFYMRNKPYSELLDFKPIKIEILLIALIGMFAFGVVMQTGLEFILEAFPNFNKSILGLVNEKFYEMFDFHDEISKLFMTDSFFTFIMLILFVGIFAGFGEEFFFRGFMQRILMNRMNFFWAIVFSGGLFGLIHTVQDMSQALFAFLISFYLGYVYLKSNNLWIPVICHIVNNSFFGTMSYLFPDEVMEKSDPSLIPLLIWIPVAIGVVYYFNRHVHIAESTPNETDDDKSTENLETTT